MVDIDPGYDHRYAFHQPASQYPWASADSPFRLPTAAKYPFRLAMSRDPTPLSQVLPKTSPRFAAMLEGSRVEIAQESWKISRKVGELIKHGGAGLVVDYGGPRLFGDSFRVGPLYSLSTFLSLC